MNDTNFEAKRKTSGSCLTLFFCHSCIHISLQGWIPSMLGAKHSSAEKDRTEWKICTETVCSAQKCSLDKALECWHSTWREGNSGILKTGSSWEDHRMTEPGPTPLHEQGHLEPVATYSHSSTCLTFCHNLWSNCFSDMFCDYWKESKSKRPHFRADWIVEMSQECLSLILWNSPGTFESSRLSVL